MIVSYNKLWKLLIDRGLKKTDLIGMAGISSASLAKLSKGENLQTDVLVKVCSALECGIEDMMEILPSK